MKPKVIKTEADYQTTLHRIDQIFEAQPGTSEGDELDLLVTLVELYESQAFPIDVPDPLTAIRFRMEQQDLKPKDLVRFLGSASKVSEVLSGKRHLSLAMMRNLVTGLGIPPAVLLGGNSLSPRPAPPAACSTSRARRGFAKKSTGPARGRTTKPRPR